MTDPLRILVFGAHPDDAEYKCGGSAVHWIRQGHAVKFISVTDGRSGHHRIGPDDLVQVRRAEARSAAGVLGVESEILPFPDGALEPCLDARHALIRVEREWRPDVVLTHRPNDYHPDHRYTSQLVQDAAYMVMVPHVCPEVPALRRNPAIFYLSDAFRKPSPFAPDAAVRIDDVLELKVKALAAHHSQFFEWLPHVAGETGVPLDPGKRLKWLGEAVSQRGREVAGCCPDGLLEACGGDRSSLIEAFEACEYGGRLSRVDFRRLFGHDPLNLRPEAE